MKYFLIAGEASGDLHASNLMKGLKAHDPGAEFRFMGGDLMGRSGGEMILHYRDTSYMMLDVLMHLGKIRRALRRVKDEISRWQPDVVIPVDFPGFNLRMARYASRRGVRVFYFITPKVWAWKQGRVEQLKRYTDKLFVILPFEVAFYEKHGIEVEYFGNPLVDGVSAFREQFEGAEEWCRGKGLGDKPLVALLPGSRKREIETILPAMASQAARYPEYRFMVAAAPAIDPDLYHRCLEGSDVGIAQESTYPMLASSTAGLITSGTATLEAALLDLPQVVLYRTGPLAYTIARRIIKINFISLVNLICGREVVKEIIQKDLGKRAGEELERILNDPAHRDRIREGYRELHQAVGEPGVCSRIGQRMVELLKMGKV